MIRQNALAPPHKPTTNQATVVPENQTTGQIILPPQVTTGSKPQHRCKECPNVYHTKKGLQQHLLLRHIENVVNCEQCSKLFRLVIFLIVFNSSCGLPVFYER